MVRSGASLIEAIMALALTGVGIAAVAASGISGARLMTLTERRTRALLNARAVLDSLSVAGTVMPGEVSREGLRISWETFDPGRPGITGITLRVRIPPDTASSIVLRAHIAPAPPGLR